MMNPSFLQLSADEAGLHLVCPRLDRPDSRILEDFGLSEEDWKLHVQGRRHEAALPTLWKAIRSMCRRKLIGRGRSLASTYDARG